MAAHVHVTNTVSLLLKRMTAVQMTLQRLRFTDFQSSVHKQLVRFFVDAM
jgi:hypothetical protein